MRAIALTIAVLVLPLGGCLRLSYDLCAPERADRHAECDASRPIDSGSIDGGELDSGSMDGGELDASASDDAGTEDAGASDAGDVDDAGIDAAVAVDSGFEDAATVMPDAGPLDAT